MIPYHLSFLLTNRKEILRNIGVLGQAKRVSLIIPLLITLELSHRGTLYSQLISGLPFVLPY
jgi:hypothetical protein|uniref:Uncharacterized protein n=2 Tax=Picea TaxID=3328 RepID=A0A101LVW6_PICGL|nr:hypothetical protein ABT39_MTgene1929 [Picea glauca]QHR89915.1 hypothetical protein Q903MT_gene3937 [Picea sitchensis]